MLIFFAQKVYLFHKQTQGVHLRRGPGVGGREASSWLGLPGLVVTISSSTLSRASGESGLLGVFAPLEASVLDRLE